MNLSKLFELQKGMDAPYSDVEDRLSKDILWLMEELGELAREWRGHKYRRPEEEQQPRTHEDIPYVCRNEDNPVLWRNPLLEEYTDCLSIILSIGLQIGYPDLTMTWLEPCGNGEALVDFKCVYKELIYLMTSIEKRRNEGTILDCYTDVFIALADLGDTLGFTWEQIEKNYIEKVEANAKRNTIGR